MRPGLATRAGRPLNLEPVPLIGRTPDGDIVYFGASDLQPILPTRLRL
jgi:hypothetical protein